MDWVHYFYYDAQHPVFLDLSDDIVHFWRGKSCTLSPRSRILAAKLFGSPGRWTLGSKTQKGSLLGWSINTRPRLEGAEAVLKLRSLVASSDFEEYWEFHRENEHQRNYLSKLGSPDQLRLRQPPKSSSGKDKKIAKNGKISE